MTNPLIDIPPMQNNWILTVTMKAEKSMNCYHELMIRNGGNIVTEYEADLT